MHTSSALMLTGLLAAALAGCSAGSPPPATQTAKPAQAQPAGLQPDARPLATGTDALQLTLEDRRLVLLSAQAASGARFADAQGNQFWEHAGEATLSLAGGEAIRCVHETAITIG
ncbi:MliC family protein [Xanthomonas campestris pv. passiflorae]|uniref:MliC family protein n=1 Tax=Xanthomonas campestris TaxID=339 RepID=UPI0024252B5F|nr:MliC family protein [Xanthomonas campestris]MBV6813167.1 MliC family protein [Xanthomonas campestris pv. passiflorae]